MGLLSKAKNEALKKKSETPQKGTLILAASSDQTEVNNAIRDVKRMMVELDSLNGKIDLKKSVIKKFADRQYIDNFVRHGVTPATPVMVQNEEGDSVTFVVQDRSASTEVKDNVFEDLVGLLGEDAANGLVYQEHLFSFDREIMSRPGVVELVEKGLESIVAELTEKGLIKDDESLVFATSRRSYTPKILDRTLDIVGRDVSRVSRFFQIVGSAITRYIKI